MSARNFFFFVVVVFVAVDARAAETEPYLAWLTPPKDGTVALNAAINARLARGLEDANADPALDCAAAARVVVRPLWTTALAFVTSDLPSWRVDHVPRSSRERERWSTSTGTYRYAPRRPVGWLVPLDPTVRVGDVLFGTDKLGHFFTNGPRYLDVFAARRAAGDDDDAAEAAAVRFGVDQENGWLGMAAAGIFSYGDLEANWRGLLFFRDLCPATASTTSPTTTPRLLRRDGRWELSAPFDIAAVVDPCWDEAFAENAYAAPEANGVRRAVVDLCARFQEPGVVARRGRYQQAGCPARHQALLAGLIAAGVAPDPAPTSLQTVCASLPPSAK